MRTYSWSEGTPRNSKRLHEKVTFNLEPERGLTRQRGKPREFQRGL